MNRSSAEREIRKLLKMHRGKVSAKSGHFSIRSQAKFLGVSPSTLSGFLNQERHLSASMAMRILKKITKDDEQISEILSGFHASPQTDLNLLLSPLEVSHFLENWQHLAILTLLEAQPVLDDPTQVSKKIGLRLDITKKCMNILKRAGLIHVKRGRLFPSGREIYFGDKGRDERILKGHINFLKHVIRFMSDSSRENVSRPCDFSFCYFPCDPNQVEKVKPNIRKFRLQTARFLEATPGLLP